MKKSFAVFVSLLAAALTFTGCFRSESIESINENQLFTIPYGNFEEQIGIRDLNGVGGLRYGVFMRDGFFYISNGDAKR